MAVDDFQMLEMAESDIRQMLDRRTPIATIFEALKNRGFSGNRQKLIGWLESRRLWTKRTRVVTRRGASALEVSEAIGNAAAKAEEKALAEQARQRVELAAQEAAKPAPEATEAAPAAPRGSKRARRLAMHAPGRTKPKHVMARKRRERKPEAAKPIMTPANALATARALSEELASIEKRIASIGEALARAMEAAEQAVRLEEAKPEPQKAKAARPRKEAGQKAREWLAKIAPDAEGRRFFSQEQALELGVPPDFNGIDFDYVGLHYDDRFGKINFKLKGGERAMAMRKTKPLMDIILAGLLAMDDGEEEALTNPQEPEKEKSDT